jgi:uncharacterized protein YjbI with pentapeptide repeats
MISSARDLGLRFGWRSVADWVRLSGRSVVTALEVAALPLLLLASLALVVVAGSRAFAWISMAPLVEVPKDRIAAENQMFITLAQVLGGGFVLTGLYFTARSYVLARRSQFAERLGVAIEGLGDDNLQRRVGSLYSLGAMASGEQRDARAITNLVCAFVRTTTTAEKYREAFSAKPREDVQTAIDVLGEKGVRLTWTRWLSIDLSDAYLAGANFAHGDFRRAQLRGANLESCSFFRARLTDADLSGSQVGHANFNQADLKRTSLFRSRASDSTFRRARLLRTNATYAELRKAAFDGSWMIRSTFGQADMTDATFDGVRERKCEFYKVPSDVVARVRS